MDWIALCKPVTDERPRSRLSNHLGNIISLACKQIQRDVKGLLTYLLLYMYVLVLNYLGCVWWLGIPLSSVSDSYFDLFVICPAFYFILRVKWA